MDSTGAKRWTFSWKDLYEEVVTAGSRTNCAGCAGCVIVCPHGVLDYDDSGGVYLPVQTETYGGPGDCSHGDKSCTSCTRACPRFRPWETRLNRLLFARESESSEGTGVSTDIVLTRATDLGVRTAGQDGGLITALLVYALEHDVIDAALVSFLGGEGASWKAVPGVARTREDVLAAAGSRYTYCANPLAYDDLEKTEGRVALVGMSCQASSPQVMRRRRAGKVAKRITLTIGLFCSKTFDDAIFEELFEAKYGIKREDIYKMNIKGVFQIWTTDGKYHEVPLRECHAWTREGCKTCPDFAAVHADISTGGIGTFDGWTLAVVRTDAGRDLLDAMVRDGVIEVRPGEDDPAAIALLQKLAAKSRSRWPSYVGAASGA